MSGVGEAVSNLRGSPISNPHLWHLYFLRWPVSFSRSRFAWLELSFFVGSAFCHASRARPLDFCRSKVCQMVDLEDNRIMLSRNESGRISVSFSRRYSNHASRLFPPFDGILFLSGIRRIPWSVNLCRVGIVRMSANLYSLCGQRWSNREVPAHSSACLPGVRTGCSFVPTNLLHCCWKSVRSFVLGVS